MLEIIDVHIILAINFKDLMLHNFKFKDTHIYTIYVIFHAKIFYAQTGSRIIYGLSIGTNILIDVEWRNDHRPALSLQ